MSRLRKASRFWRYPDARKAAQRAIVAPGTSVFRFDQFEIFARRAPLEIELGAGRGDFILEYAASHPERDFLAVELSGTVGQLLAVRCGRSELTNLKVLRADVRTLVNLLLPDRSVSAFHVYFPDPWPKERHVKHRMFAPTMVRNLARTLEPHGSVFAASDVEEWASNIFSMLEGGGFTRIDDRTPGARRTGFGRRYLKQGKNIFAASFVITSPGDPV